jgi:hypothetical protein
LAPTITHQFSTAEPVGQVRQNLLAEITPMLNEYGYQLAAQNEQGLTYLHRYRSIWIITCCIIFFPIGLLALLAPKREDTILFSLTPQGQETNVVVTGEVPVRRLRNALVGLPASVDGAWSGAS